MSFIFTVYAHSKGLKTEDVKILFDETTEYAAQEVIDVYPSAKAELVGIFGWDVNFKPAVILLKDRDMLKKATGSSLIVALAIPEQYMIVLDMSRVIAKPFTLKTTLKHELCHLLMHHNIESDRLPRWLNEGVCQWASDGIAEIMMSNSEDILSKATLSDRLISLGQLGSFPHDEQSVLLAYAQSKSLVEYIIDEFGKEDMVEILNHLKNGYSLEDSISRILSISISELEMKWHDYLKRRHTKFFYLSRNLEIILFSFAALVTVYGFIRMIRKKMTYKDEEDDTDDRKSL